jgi:drug/metabolite transporter (DMT)-like permease
LRDSLKVIFVFALCCLIWGSTWLAIKIGLFSLTPLFSSGFRFTVASIVIFATVRITGIKIHTDKISIRLYIIMGFFSFVFPFGLVYWAEQFIPSGLASVLFAVYPFFILLFSYLFIPDEKIGFYKVLGIILGFGGILVIFSDSIGGDISSYLLGMIAVVLSGAMQASIAVIIKKYGFHLNPLSMNFIPMIIAGIVLILLGFLMEDFSQLKFDSSAILSVLYLAIFGSIVTFTSYYWLLKRISVVILSLIAFITPIVALVLGAIVYDEQLSSRALWGTILVLTGLLWANLSNVKKLKKQAGTTTEAD